MHIQSIKLQNFRCFKEQSFTMDNQFVIIHGNNGSGKTSVLEALHYACYLRSFRTHLNRDLIGLEHEHFFVNVDFNLQETFTNEQITIGYSEKEGKLVKLNQRPVQSYKELIKLYRIVTLTADDSELVSGSPSLRRDFLNYALMLFKPEILQNFKRYKTILEQRNKLLLKQGAVTDELLVWTEKLWQESVTIQHERRSFLQAVQAVVNTFLVEYFSTEEDQLQITLTYAPRKKDSAATFQDFWGWYSEHGLTQELEWRRTQFGAHLDDFIITFQNKKARIFASRGQQKLIAFLIKTAELQLTTQSGEPGIFLLDDFLTDFDTNRLAMCLKTLQNLRFQVIITTPTNPQFILQSLDSHKTCLIEL